MGNEHGEWIMYGVEKEDPRCLKTPEALLNYVNQVGFLPLFKNEIPGFSVEERTISADWWSDDQERDPWFWREILARSGKVAYGKFFDRKAGYISLEWLPHFLNWRREGYDFDARWDDEKATWKQKKIMDLFDRGEEYYSFELKEFAGFGKGGEKNFEGTLTDLQMQVYLTVKDFRQRLNKAGQPYGWAIAVYSTPEVIWGNDLTEKAYRESPGRSAERIRNQLFTINPDLDEKTVRRFLKG